MADTSNCTTAPSALAQLFEERLHAYLYARDKVENQPDDIGPVESNHYADAYLYAENLALHTPAGDLSDLRAKAEILWGDPDNTPSRCDIEPFLADLVRLTGREASRVFNPSHWLVDRRAKGTRLAG